MSLFFLIIHVPTFLESYCMQILLTNKLNISRNSYMYVHKKEDIIKVHIGCNCSNTKVKVRK